MLVAMAGRPACIVTVADVGALERDATDGVGWRIRPLSDAAGLTRMGVKLREIASGCAGTHLHFHDVEEEWAYVLSGRGHVRVGELVRPVRAGSFAGFPPGPRPHHFVADDDTPLVVLEGGERRGREDLCTYPELGVAAREGVDEPIDVAALPPFEGDAGQVLHLDDVDERAGPHPLAADAVRHQRSASDRVGLLRQVFVRVRLEPGVESTAFHTHESTDEWVYVLSGEGHVRLSADAYPIGAGDFIAHPARGPAHVMRAGSELVYLMGGQRDADDVVRYPEHGMERTRDGLRRAAPA